MSDADFIRELLEDRAGFYLSCMYCEEDVEKDRPIYDAKRQILKQIASEIEASVTPPTNTASMQTAIGPRQHWALLAEMGGCLRAFLFREESAAMTARGHFMRAFRMEEEVHPHAVCNVVQTEIKPRLSPVPGSIDGRFALVWWMDGSMNFSLHETRAELDAAIDEFETEHDWDIEEHCAMYSYHAILIPS